MYRNLGFEIQRVLDSGAFKTVFLAQYHGVPVALKVLDVNRGEYRAQLEWRASREVRLMAGIDSPFVAKVFDFSLGGMQFDAYIAEEFIGGPSLRTKMDSGSIGYFEILDIMDDVFQALLVCASQPEPIIHRDVKPSNIMLRENGQAVLTDFGLARTKEDSTVTVSGMTIGTLKYAPPEFIHFNSGLLDDTSDLFSFGVMCYEMLTGEHPFITEEPVSREDAVRMMYETDPVPVHQKNAHVSVELSRLIMRLIRRQRGERYPSVEHSYSRFQKIRSKETE